MRQKTPPAYRPVRLSRDYLVGTLLDAVAHDHRREWERFSAERRAEVREAGLAAIDALGESLATGSPVFLEEAARHVQSRFAALHYPEGFAGSFFNALAGIAATGLPEDYRDGAAGFLKRAKAALRAPAGKGAAAGRRPALPPAAREFVKAGLAGDAGGCRAVVQKAVAGKTSLAAIYTGIFIPALRETGRLWEEGKASIPQEHFIAALVRQEMDRLRAGLLAAGPEGRRKRGVAVAACVGAELHELGIRMAADLLEADGWEVYYLGANTPVAAILGAVQARRPALLLLSVTMPARLAEAEYLVRSLRAGPDTAKVKVIAGGAPFRLLPALGGQIGADAAPASLEEIVPAARRLAGAAGAGTPAKKAQQRR